jgi:4-hydroxy-3-methylbut-2-enyl diphosphate reductase
VAIEAQEHGIPHIYGYHEVVHNRDVVAAHEARGVIFIDEVDQIPPESIVVTSAHGVGPEVKVILESRGSLVFDASCPLVLHTHRGVERARQNDEKVVYICHGKPGQVAKLHDEVLGMVGHLDYVVYEGQLMHAPLKRTYVELNEDPATIPDFLCEEARYRIISQTTLHSDDALRYREELGAHIGELQPHAVVNWSDPGEVCLAVRRRQDGVRQLLELQPDHLVVVTDPNSKNGTGYVSLANEIVDENNMTTQVIAVANADEAKNLGLDGLVAMTASASTPDETLLAVAQEMGLDEPPVVERKSFQLKHAQEGYIGRQIENFIGRTGLTPLLGKTIQP